MGAWLIGAELLLAVQATEPAVVGAVRDGESGAALAGAVVALTDVGRAVVTDDAGRYALAAVPPGPQHLTVRRLGYAPRTLHALVPRHGQLEINIALRPLPARLRAVEVRPRVAVRGVDDDSSSLPDRRVSAAAMRNHPLLAEPDVLLALGGGDVVTRPESPSGLHIQGGASDQTAYTLDGVPVFSPYHAAGTFGAWNPDAIERSSLASAFPSPADPDALSGTVAATTKAPGARLVGRGSIGTTQARATALGPLGRSGAGYLVATRTGFPGFIAPEREPSYLGGETGDLLAKLEVPAAGGQLRALLYESENELDAAASGEVASAPPPGTARNAFEWWSRSMGLEWSRRIGGATLRLRSWRATGGAGATWDAAAAAPLTMTSERRDDGFLAVVGRSGARARTLLGTRLERSRSSYAVRAASGESATIASRPRIDMATLFAQHERPLLRELSAKVALSATAASGGVRLAPRVELRWTPARALALATIYSRSHQFLQSLRNPESVVANIFPADLFLGASEGGLPVARSDRVVLAVELRPADGVLLRAQGFVRDFDGLVLVAPASGEPFAVRGFASGSGISRGLSLEGGASGARYGVLASYGWQRVRYDHAGASYVPEHAATHVAEAGFSLFPSPTLSIRLGATGALGRRTAGVAGPLEWESCNLVDRGCELGGTPRLPTDDLGGTRLPAYVRVDAGMRKHWHLRAAGRSAQIGVFGTVTNVLGRRNVLTVARDPAAGATVEIGMRPIGPLVVGLDWEL